MPKETLFSSDEVFIALNGWLIEIETHRSLLQLISCSMSRQHCAFRLLQGLSRVVEMVALRPFRPRSAAESEPRG